MTQQRCYITVMFWTTIWKLHPAADLDHLDVVHDVVRHDEHCACGLLTNTAWN